MIGLGTYLHADRLVWCALDYAARHGDAVDEHDLAEGRVDNTDLIVLYAGHNARGEQLFSRELLEKARDEGWLTEEPPIGRRRCPQFRLTPAGRLQLEDRREYYAERI